MSWFRHKPPKYPSRKPEPTPNPQDRKDSQPS